MFTLALHNRLSVGLLEPRHAPWFFPLLASNRYAWRQFMPWVEGIETPEALASFLRDSLLDFARGRALPVGFRVAEEPAGLIGVALGGRKAELTFTIGAQFQGQGFESEACQAIIDHCFDHLSIHRVEMVCGPDHLAHRAVAERLGFQLEGTLRQAAFSNGQWHDRLLYALLIQDRRPAADSWGPGPFA